MRALINLFVLHFKWLFKIVSLKMVYGNSITLHWNDRISPSVKIRINGNGNIYLGENVELRENCILNVSDGGCIIIKDRVFMNDMCCVNARTTISIGEDTMLGQGVKIYDHDHDYKSDNIKIHFKQAPTTIGENVWLCSNVTVLKGCLIGDGSVVAAGTVVRDNICSNVLCYTKREMGINSISK